MDDPFAASNNSPYSNPKDVPLVECIQSSTVVQVQVDPIVASVVANPIKQLEPVCEPSKVI